MHVATNKAFSGILSIVLFMSKINCLYYASICTGLSCPFYCSNVLLEYFDYLATLYT